MRISRRFEGTAPYKRIGLAIVLALLLTTPAAAQIDDAGLQQLYECESGGDYTADTGNQFYGAAQFTQSTWDAVTAHLGLTGWVGVRPSLAPPEVQDAAARALWDSVSIPGVVTGPGNWPVCRFVVSQGSSRVGDVNRAATTDEAPVPVFAG